MVVTDITKTEEIMTKVIVTKNVETTQAMAVEEDQDQDREENIKNLKNLEDAVPPAVIHTTLMTQLVQMTLLFLSPNWNLKKWRRRID